MLAFNLLKIGNFFKKYAFYIYIFIFAILALFIFSNINAISEKFGLETRATLKGQVEAHKVINQQTTEANKNLNIELSKEKESNISTTTIIENKVTRDLTLSKDITDIKQKRDEVVSKVINKPNVEQRNESTPDSSSKYTPEEIQSVSLANITSIWDTYERVERV